MNRTHARTIALLLFLAAACFYVGAVESSVAPMAGDFIWRQGFFFILLAFVYRVTVRIARRKMKRERREK